MLTRRNHGASPLLTG